MSIKPVLIIGGPADGQRVLLDVSKQRTYRVAELRGAPPAPNEPSADPVPLDAPDVHYALGTVQGAFHGVYYVGVQNLSDCVICALMAGYHRPIEHHTDLNVAEHLVTLLGGKDDGMQLPMPDGSQTVTVNSTYQIVPLICKDGRVFRVGVLDMMRCDPMHLLYDGYRVGVRK